MSLKSRLIVVLAGLLIGLAFLWLSMRTIEPGSLRRALEGLHYGWAALAAVAAILFVVVKAHRWRLILRPVVACNLRFLTCLVAAGIAASLVVAHTGELVRAVQVSRHERVAASAVLATIGVERVLDIAAVLLLVAAVLAYAPKFSGPLASTAIVLAACVSAGVGLVLLWLYAGERAAGRMSSLLKHMPRRPRDWFVRQVSQSRTGVEIARNPGALPRLLALSLVQWACIIACVWASCMAIGLAASLSASVAVLALMVVGVTLPTAPGYLGTTQLAFVVGLGVSGVPIEQAFASSLVYSLTVNLFMMLLGAAAWLLGCGIKAGSVRP